VFSWLLTKTPFLPFSGLQKVNSYPFLIFAKPTAISWAINIISIYFGMDLPAKQGITSSMGRKKNMTQNKTKKKSANSLIKKLGLIIIGLFLLYVIAGFWVVPPLLKPRLEKELSGQIGRKVTIEKIKLNPLVLSATTTNLTVYETDGEPFAGFKELLIDAELSSIVRWA
jgi:hypothetical protein